MTISESGISAIKRFESFRPVSYQDQGGVWTLGFGDTKHAAPGVTCTEKEADGWLRAHIAEHIEGVIANEVTAVLNQNEYDMLVSFLYNLGAGVLAHSELLKKLNVSDYTGAAEQFLRWDRCDGVISHGLDVRRAFEKTRFLKAIEA